MSDVEKIALNLRRFREGVSAHDRENPTHSSFGIGLSHHDMQRLDFEEGEELWPGIVVQADGGQAGNFRVLCDGDHDESPTAVATEAVSSGVAA